MKRLFVCENCGKIFMEGADGTVRSCWGYDMCSDQCANEFMNRKKGKQEMNENYIVINGKKAKLTDEQMKALGIAHNRKNPFDRIQNDYSPYYFYINADGQLNYVRDYHGSFDDAAYNNANYFNEQDFAKQVSLHQTLCRKLLKFAYDNGYHDTAEWDGLNRHWGIYYNVETHQFAVDCHVSHKRVGYWFSSDVGAARAIDEVILPFMREHPEFVW